MGGTQRVWIQPAHLVVKESQLRAMFEIPDDQDLDDLDPQRLQDMVGEAMLCVDTWNVELDEDWREDYPEPWIPSERCRCSHWLSTTSWHAGHPAKLFPDDPPRPCKVCGCQQPEREPDPPWVKQADPVTR
jgi:hypothetical protein